MAQSLLGSLLYALEGLAHAFMTELNLKVFLLAYACSLVIAAFLRLTPLEWAVLLLSGGIFLTVELINTALERFTDAFDAHAKNQNDIHFEAIKATKDVAAGASLVAGCTWVAIMTIFFVPRIWVLLSL